MILRPATLSYVMEAAADIAEMFKGPVTQSVPFSYLVYIVLDPGFAPGPHALPKRGEEGLTMRRCDARPRSEILSTELARFRRSASIQRGACTKRRIRKLGQSILRCGQRIVLWRSLTHPRVDVVADGSDDVRPEAIRSVSAREKCDVSA